MTAITPISTLALSALTGGEDIMAGEDLALLSGGKGDGFLGLLAALLNTAAPDEDILPELSADMFSGLLDKPQTDMLAGLLGQNGSIITPEELARLLLQIKKAQDKDKQEESQDNAIVLGGLVIPAEATDSAAIALSASDPSGGGKEAITLSAPVVTGQKVVVEDQGNPAKPGIVLTEKDLPLAANLAGKADADTSGAKEERRDFTSFLREAATISSARTAPGEAPRMTASIPTPVSSHAWGERLGEQITWMARNGQQQVDFRLHPANLGPLTISLNMDGDKASIHFTVATMEVRQAIEDAMPRLREMMAANGVTLGQADVDEQARREKEAQMAGQHNMGGQPNDEYAEYAENPEGHPNAAGEYAENRERPLILSDLVGGQTMPFIHANGRIGGIDLFA